LRLESKGRIILHPIKINNEYQGLQERDLNRKTFTNKINYDIMNLLDPFAMEPNEKPSTVESNHQTNKGRRKETLEHLPSKW
jgi:hypothetical protein